MQTVILLGVLEKEPEIKILPDGRTVASMVISVEDNGKKFFANVYAWDKNAKKCNQKGGASVHVVGKLMYDTNGQPKVYASKEGKPMSTFDIRAVEISFVEVPEPELLL